MVKYENNVRKFIMDSMPCWSHFLASCGSTKQNATSLTSRPTPQHPCHHCWTHDVTSHVTTAGPTCKKPRQHLLTSRTLKCNLIVTNLHTYGDKSGCHKLTMIIDKNFHRHRFNLISDKKFHLVTPMNL